MTDLQRRYDALRRQRTAHGATLAELTTLDEIWTLAQDAQRLREGFLAECRDVEQTLGHALGFPMLRDCPEIGGQPEDTDVMVFDYTPATLAAVAAERLARFHFLAVQASDPKTTGKAMRAARDALVEEGLKLRPAPADPVADALRAQVIPPMPQPPTYARLLTALREEG